MQDSTTGSYTPRPAKWAAWQLPDQPADDSFPDARDGTDLMSPLLPPGCPAAGSPSAAPLLPA